jgi:hypothetical protein
MMTRLILACVAVVLLLGLGAAVYLLLEEPGTSGGVEEDVAAETPLAPPTPPEEAPTVRPEESSRTAAAPYVEVRLRLVLDPYAHPSNRGAPPRGRDRTASLLGRVTGAGGAPAPGAKLAFVAGLNRDALTTSDAEGWFSLAGLFPGRGKLRTEAPGRLPVEREIALPPGEETRWDFHLAAPVDVAGKVVDREGKAIAGAHVRIDGRTEFTDGDGVFRFGQVTPGDVLVAVRAEGFAPRRETLVLRPELPVGPDDFQVVLEKAGTLRGEVRGAPVEGGTAYVSLVPEKPPTDRSFPFEDFGRIEISGNGPFAISDVPLRKPYQIRAFHPFTRAQPAERFAYLTGEGDRNLAPVVFRLEPVPKVGGTVRDGETGEPLAGARVLLEPADFFDAVRSIHPGAGPALDAYVVDPPAVFRFETTTDGRGRFLAATGPARGRRWLEVSAPGYRELERAVGADTEDVEGLFLFREETFASGASVEIVFDPAPAGEVALTLNGSAKPPVLLDDGGPLVVPSLVPGVYELEVRRGNLRIAEDRALLVGGRRRVRVSLP